MEGIQESDSEKLSTKSSRKRQRKKQAAALEKLILASEAAGFCKQEPTENSDRESVKIKGCLSDIVFNYNSVKGKECHAGNSSLDGNVNTNPRSVCCEPSENLLQGKNQDTDPGATVPHTKRRRNRKKALNSEACVSADVHVAQKNIEKQSTQPVKVSQKDNLSQVKSLLNRCVDLPSFADKTNNLKEAAQLNNTSDAKSAGETADRESTLSRSKRRRNRKKTIGSLEQSDSQTKIVNDEDLKTQIIPLHPPLDFVGQQSPQKKSPNGEGVKIHPPISLVSEKTEASKTVQPGVNKSAPQSGEISTDNILKKEPRPSDSELPKTIGTTGKKKVDPNSSSPLKEGEEKIVKRIKLLQEPLVPEKKESSSVEREAGVGKSKCSEKDKAEGCDPLREIEKRLSSSVFQKISDPSKLTEGHAAVMAEAKKSMSKGRPSPKGSLSKDKTKILTEGASEFTSASIVTTSFLGDEVDRASASIHSLTVSPQSGGIHTFISKTKNDPEQNFAGIPVASKGAPIKIDPVSVEALDEVVVCLNKVKLENKNEKGSMDVKKSSTVQDSSSKSGYNVKEKPGINAFALKESSRTREADILSNHGQNIENKVVSHNKKVFTSQKLCTDGEPASKNGANLNAVSNVSLIKEAMVGELQMGKDSSKTEKMSETSKHNDQSANADLDLVEKSKEKVIAEREARKAAKLAKKQKDKVPKEKELTKETIGTQSTMLHDADLDKKEVSPMEVQPIVVPSKVQPDGEKPGAEKSKAELRAERRAKQEAQRAAKAAAGKAPPAQNKAKTTEPKVAKVVPSEGIKATMKRPSVNLKEPKKEQGAKLLSRLGWGDGRMKRSPSEDATLKETQSIHPAIVQLSTKFTDRIVSGSNARCLAFVQAIKKAILDYKTPPQKELGRDLEARLLAPSLAYLESQRPHAVSVSNATKFLKWQLTQLQPLQQCSIGNSTASPLETKKLAVNSDEEAKKILIDGLDSYIWEKIKLAEQAVCETLKDKIKDGDVILTYGCSYLLQQILTQAKKSETKFKVFVVDGRPWREGREMLRCLVAMGIPCSYVLLSAASSVMRQVNKVLLGAHALLSNGYVMSRVGVSQVALLANAHNVPVLVACETHKFCERVQSDSFVYNEMGEPDGLAQLLGGEDGPLTDWRSIPSLSLLNLSYDVTPPELVTAVATELAVLPCTSVPVVLRVRPAEPIASRH